MIKTKKVISIVVALMLLCNVFTVLSSAAVADNYAYKIAVVADKTSYAPGDVATISVYIEGSTRGGYDLTKVSDTGLPFGWNNNVLGISAADKAEALTSGVMDLDLSATGIKTHSTVIDSSESEYGWNEVMSYGLILNSVATCDDITEAAFTVDIEIAADAAEGDYYFGISPYYLSNVDDAYLFAVGASEMYDGAYANCYEVDLGVDSIYDLSQAMATITVGSDPIKWKQNQVRPAESGIANAIDIGVKAEFTEEDIPITFDAKGTSDNFAAVGAVLKVNGTAMDPAESAFVYEVSEGVFQYRVIIKDVAKDSDDVYTLQFFAKDTNGNYTYGETVDVTVADCDLTNLPA